MKGRVVRERLTNLTLRLKALLRRRQFDRDLDDELAFHLAMKEQAHRKDGVTAEDARARARQQFGSPLRVKESLRDMWQWSAVDRAWQDLRFAARTARRDRAFTLVVVLTLALGIGATTAMFSIVDAVLLRPFPFPEPNGLVIVWETNRDRGLKRMVGSIANYTDWQRDATAFAELGAWELRNDNRTDGAQPEQVQGAVASSAFFRALRVQPALGRFFRADEDQPANRHVAVLGQDYWRRAFGGDASAIGRAVTINGESYTIVGVMPALRPPFRADIWRPLAPDVARLDRGDHSALIVGRLPADQPTAAATAKAEAELQTIARRLEAAYPQDNRGWNVRVESLYDAVVSETTRRAMQILMAAVGLLLLVACVNVANLLLSRAAGRHREMATRLALGAARGRVVRQLLTESAVLAGAGAIAGLLVAAWGLRLVQWLYPADIPGLAEAQINPYALGFAVVTAILTTLLVGLAPALQLSRIALQGGLRQTTRSATDAPKTRRLRQTLVVAEIGLALVLLVGAGLLLRSVERLRQVPLGFNPEPVLTAKIGVNNAFDSQPRYIAFVDRLLAELKTRPGIAAAGIASSVPFGGDYTVRQVRREADAGAPPSQGISTAWRVIGGDYFSAVGIPLKAGRLFRDSDDPQRVPRVTIISESLAQKLWPGEDPVGRRMLVGDAMRPYEVVGVVGHARLTVLGRDPEPVMYYPYRQFTWASLTIALRASGDADPLTLANTVRAAVATVAPDQPVFDVHPMQDLVERAAATPTMNASLLTLFAGLALTLSAIGVYGVMSYAAAQRTGEIGLRLALGAQPRDVLALVWRNGLMLTAIGLTLGLLAALAAGRALTALLYEVSPTDPVTFATGLGLMLAVSLAACYLPARRAMRTDPVVALRHE